MAKFAILYRVHQWDVIAEANYRQLVAQTREADIWVVANETDGPIPAAPRQRHFRITEDDAAALGLPEYPKGRVFWFNNDFGLYLFALAKPEYDYYVLVEHDVYVHFDVDALLQRVASTSVDLLAMPNRVHGRRWDHLDTCTEVWPEQQVEPNLLMFAAFSKRAVDLLLPKRLALAERYLRNDLKRWPIAEGFVATALREAGYGIADVSDYLDTSRYDWWPPVHFNEARSSVPGRIFHPVLSGIAYLDSALRYRDVEPADWFDPDSPLRRQLDHEPLELVAPVLANAFLEREEFGALFGLVSELDAPLRERIAPQMRAGIDRLVAGKEDHDLAAHAVAFQSSVSQWSQGESREADAGRPLAGEPNGSYSMHTDIELRPWWMVDLGTYCVVRRIAVFNRLDAEAARLRHLSIWSSLDARNWTRSSTWSLAVAPGGLVGLPFEVRFDGGLPCRYVRLELDGRDCLHFDKVQVGGVAAPWS